jgi:hypothetical protein
MGALQKIEDVKGVTDESTRNDLEGVELKLKGA